MTVPRTEPPLAAYLAARQALVEWVRDNLPDGASVIVECGRYAGPGIVVNDDAPPDRVAVRLPNDNVRWYDLKNVRRADDKPKEEPAS